MLVVCGVSGVGKTTIGRLLADALEIPFFDADDFHPATNVDKMSNGIPLDDRDRRPWLDTLASRLSAWEKKGGAVLACSALKERYRTVLGSRCSERIRWIILHAGEALLADRIESRTGHFFDRRLLRSQLDALEVADYGWLIDVQPSPQEIVNEILSRLRYK